MRYTLTLGFCGGWYAGSEGDAACGWLARGVTVMIILEVVLTQMVALCMSLTGYYACRYFVCNARGNLRRGTDLLLASLETRQLRRLQKGD